jgi:hypothetical protein
MNIKSVPISYWILFGLALIAGIIPILLYVPLMPGYFLALADTCVKDGFEFVRTVACFGWLLYPIFPLTGLIGSLIARIRQHRILAYSLLLLSLSPYLIVSLMIWLLELVRGPCF